ncbi:MAG TPA: hypothetical protein VN029_07230 [Sphingomonas sp.]|nr:hypothetical protein [Sphingomonas sp.]
MLTLAAMIGGLAVQTAPASPPLAEVLPRAAAFCVKAAESTGRVVPAGADFYLPDAMLTTMSERVAKNNPKLAKSVADLNAGMKPLSTAPELIQRVLQTSRGTRLFGTAGVVRFPAASGSAWVFLSRGSACDLYVTGSDAPLGPLVQLLATKLESEGWTTAKAVDATEAMPLSQRVMLHMAPLPDAPANGTRATLQWLSPVAAQPDGVQLEINYMNGNIEVKQPAPVQNP